MLPSKLTPMIALGLALASGSSAHATALVDDALARQHFELGRSMYKRADYLGAIRQFEDAFRLSPRPALLYDIGRCHENLGQHARAVTVYERYLRTGPRDADAVRARVSNLRALSAGRQAERRPHSALPPESRGPSSRWLGWSVLGGGVLLAATGAVLTGLAKSTQREVEQNNRDGIEYASFQAQEARGRDYGIAGPVLLGIGGAGAAAGITLLLLRQRAPAERPAISFSPTLAPGQASIQLAGSF